MSITDNGQEFIDRESQLPADPREFGAGVVPGELRGVPLGNPAVDYDVRSTYDVMPVNGFKFTFSQAVAPTDVGETGATWTFAFTVPEGFVAVVRWYQWALASPTGDSTEWSDSLGALQRNGVDYLYNTGVFLGPASERMPVFMLVDETQTFGVRVVNEDIISPPSGQLTIHGDLLLKTGRAYPYEIANPVGVIRRSTLAPESLFQPPAPPPRPQVITKEVIREVIREVPQQPSQPAPPETPPFEIKWIKQANASEGSCPAGNGMFWAPATPVQVRGKWTSRKLVAEEVRKYERWIAEHCPPPEPARVSFSISSR